MSKVLVTVEQFKKLFPTGKVEFVPLLNEKLEAAGINTLPRVASFLAQCGAETNFLKWEENLNYSVEGLVRIFPKRVSPELAKKLAHNPEAIANYVYGARMGNGPAATGDGYKHRGRGLIQVTGHDNYVKLAMALKKSVDETIAYVMTIPGALDSAIWYWGNAKCNGYADKSDIRGQTIAINGWLNGFEHRASLYELATKAIKANF